MRLLERASTELLAQLLLAERPDLPHLPFVLQHLEGIAGLRDPFETEDLHRDRGAALAHAVSEIVEHRPDFAVHRAGDERVSDAQRAALHQDGRHRPARSVQLRVQDHSRGQGGRVRLQVAHVGHQEDHLEQLVDPLLLPGGDRDRHDVSPPVLDQKTLIGELLFDAVEVCARLVDLVDRHDHRHAGGARVVNRLDRLRHDAVVGGDDQDHDVRDPGAARPHHGEGLVAGRVDEGDAAVPGPDVIRADVLRDAAGLARSDVRFPDCVQERGLAVVHVSHDRDHRVARAQARLVDLFGVLEGHLLLKADHLRVETELAADLPGNLGVEWLVDGGEDAAADEPCDDVLGLAVHLLGQLLDRDAFGDGDLLQDLGHRGDRRRHGASDRRRLTPRDLGGRRWLLRRLGAGHRSQRRHGAARSRSGRRFRPRRRSPGGDGHSGPL